MNPFTWACRTFDLKATFLLFLFLGLQVSNLQADLSIERSVVQISCTSQSWNFKEPWKSQRPRGGTGTGFFIGEERIMTNAHVVSDARYIEIKRIGVAQKVIARVAHIAHDCDLAILEVQDPEFFTGMVPLAFGGLPEVDSVVTTYGFPMGGTHLSVTRGVVSRVQMWTYSHSGADAHLVIQTDAAINPGNSGGPVMQEGKVVGVAFQGMRQADNIGYLIPTTVVEHVLEDVKDGQLDGFGELGISYRQDLLNPMVRRILQVPEDRSGVVVTQSFPRMPAYGKIFPMDVLMEIDDFTIMDDAMILLDGRHMNFAEWMERKQVGEKIRLKLWREGQAIDVEVPVKEWDMIIDHRRPHDVVPTYLIWGGLCFTPLSKGYLLTRGGVSKAPLELRFLYNNLLAEEELPSHEPLVVSTRLPHPVNQGAESSVGRVLDSVNGETVESLVHLSSLLEKSEGPFVSLSFLGQEIPLVLKKDTILAAEKEILKDYRIPLKERL